MMNIINSISWTLFILSYRLFSIKYLYKRKCTYIYLYKRLKCNYYFEYTIHYGNFYSFVLAKSKVAHKTFQME